MTILTTLRKVDMLIAFGTGRDGLQFGMMIIHENDYHDHLMMTETMVTMIMKMMTVMMLMKMMMIMIPHKKLGSCGKVFSQQTDDPADFERKGLVTKMEQS